MSAVKVIPLIEKHPMAWDGNMWEGHKEEEGIELSDSSRLPNTEKRAPHLSIGCICIPTTNQCTSVLYLCIR